MLRTFLLAKRRRLLFERTLRLILNNGCCQHLLHDHPEVFNTAELLRLGLLLDLGSDKVTWAPSWLV